MTYLVMLAWFAGFQLLPQRRILKAINKTLSIVLDAMPMYILEYPMGGTVHQVQVQ